MKFTNRGGVQKFLSPKLRQNLADSLMNGLLSKVQHDPYKSDVYSLGYSFLTLSLHPNSTSGQVTEEGIWAEVQTLKVYSDNYKQFLFSMLRFNEEDRADFQQLRDCLRAYLFPTVATPETPPTCIVHPWHSRSTDPANPHVVLTCSSAHVVCSQHCFRDYVFACTRQYALDIDSVICPICRTPVSLVLIHQAYGSENAFEQECNKLGICVCGSQQNVRKRYNCSHRWCKECLRCCKEYAVCPAPQCGASLIVKRDSPNCALF